MVQWISLVDLEELSLPDTSTDVWLCTFCHVTHPHHLNIVVLLKEGTVPGLEPQGGFIKKQKGLCVIPK